MKVILAGGTGQIGKILSDHFKANGHQVIILSRSKHSEDGFIAWDGQSLGEWAKSIDGCDVVINLTGKNVNCRYTKKNFKEMLNSRVLSTQIIGEAIRLAKNPPSIWLQMSTATIYSHRFDAANDEFNGIIGGNEPEVPASWSGSILIAKEWEKALNEAKTPKTRKVVLRSAVVMSLLKGGPLSILHTMTRFGLGGKIDSGKQYVSWIHQTDFINAINFIITKHEIEGIVNIASPYPLPQNEFMREIRKAAKVPFGIPATRCMAAVGAFLLRTETELVFKSRRVTTTRLAELGFEFKYPSWTQAVQELLKS